MVMDRIVGINEVYVVPVYVLVYQIYMENRRVDCTYVTLVSSEIPIILA